MKKLHFQITFKQKHWRELTHMQLQTVLESHMFLKEKIDEVVKGWSVAGGNKQHVYISKEDESSLNAQFSSSDRKTRIVK